MINNKFAFILVLFIGFALQSFSQITDSLKTDTAKSDTAKSDTLFRTIPQEDSVLRIRNLNPYITLHVDSTLQYKLDINKDQSKYYWFLKNSPVGLKVERNSGLLTFKAEKAFFLRTPDGLQ